MKSLSDSALKRIASLTKRAEYEVGIGGEPKSNRTFGTLEEAQKWVEDEAYQKATEEGVDGHDIDLYGDEDEGGACPMGDEGSYWPYYKRISK